jgi:flagellar operon protein
MSAAIPTNPALIPSIGQARSGAPAGAPVPPSTRGPGQGEIRHGELRQGEGQSIPKSGPAFAELLHKASDPEPLHFSRHALERVQRRSIELDPSTLSRLNEGVGRAAGKGARDSVVLVDGTAFVVSVGNRTVVTAVGAQHMREHVFTNIDSAVIA